MPLNINMDQSILEIERYYASKCDGNWEHHLGISIESTDNPGWILKFDDLPMDNTVLSPIVGQLLLNLNAQISTDGTAVRLFAPTLRECILASAILLIKSYKRET
jgi:hypothetical protein